MKKKIIITGGSGFLTKNLVKHLDLNKFDVVLLTRDDVKLKDLKINYNIDIKKINWESTSDIKEKFTGANYIIHTAAMVPSRSDANNSTIIKSSLKICKKICSLNLDVEKFIYISTLRTCINTKKTIGFIPSNHLSKISNFDHDWKKIGFQMLNTPYKWGGRTNQGLDCSALLQLSFQTVGINLPRNSSEQISFMHNSKMFDNVKINQEEISSLKEGTIIFWDGHVGYMCTSRTLLHANAFHMKVEQEPIVETIKRFENDKIFVTSFFTFNY